MHALTVACNSMFFFHFHFHIFSFRRKTARDEFWSIDLTLINNFIIFFSCISAIGPYQALFIAPCSHAFHYKCINTLLQQGYMFLCPLCRQVANLAASVSMESLVDYADDEETELDSMDTRQNEITSDKEKNISDEDMMMPPNNLSPTDESVVTLSRNTIRSIAQYPVDLVGENSINNSSNNGNSNNNNSNNSNASTNNSRRSIIAGLQSLQLSQGIQPRGNSGESEGNTFSPNSESTALSTEEAFAMATQVPSPRFEDRISSQNSVEAISEISANENGSNLPEN